MARSVAMLDTGAPSSTWHSLDKTYATGPACSCWGINHLRSDWLVIHALGTPLMRGLAEPGVAPCWFERADGGSLAPHRA